MGGDCELPLLDFLVEVFVISTLERKMSNKHHVEEDSCGPNIDWRTMVFFFSDYFRSHVRWSATENIEFFIGWDDDGKPEIDYFYIFLFVEHDVFEFNISVDDIFIVKVLET